MAEGETRAKLAREEAEARVEAVISEAEARVQALIAETYRRMAELARRKPGAACTPRGYDGETVGAEPLAEPPSSRADPVPFHLAVAVRAYYKAERRGFEPGRETTDWLEAERELMAPTPWGTPEHGSSMRRPARPVDSEKTESRLP